MINQWTSNIIFIRWLNVITQKNSLAHCRLYNISKITSGGSTGGLGGLSPPIISLAPPTIMDGGARARNNSQLHSAIQCHIKTVLDF